MNKIIMRSEHCKINSVIFNNYIMVRKLFSYQCSNMFLDDHLIELEKVDLVITDTPAFQILNETMKGMKHVVIYLTTYSFHGHQKFTNSCNWQCSKLFIACQINLNQITCNLFLFSFTIYIKTLIIRHMMETHL